MAALTPVVDFWRALGQFDDPAFRRVILRGLAVALAGLVLIAWATFTLVAWIMPETVVLPVIGPIDFIDTVASWAALGMLLAASVFLMVPVAALVVGFFLDDVAAAVEARHYPHLPAVAEMGLVPQILDGLRFLGIVLAANLLALVVYLALPPLAPFIFWAVNGYLLGREYFHLVAARRLGPEGATLLRRRHALRIWLVGTAMAVPLTVPVLNLIVPVLGVAVFTHQFHRLGAP